MTAAREIKTRINSIQNTAKITGAMEMVAASKMRKAQASMESTKPYSQKIHEVIKHIAESHSEYHHPYLSPREIKRVGIIVVTTDRGLCGGLNHNLLKLVAKTIRDWQAQEVEVDLCLFGRKAENFFRRYGGKVLAAKTELGDKPGLTEVVGPVVTMLQAFDEGDIDALYVAGNDFVNTMVQQPYVHQLLPLAIEEGEKHYRGHWDYIYEPEAQEILDKLLQRYIEAQVYQSVIENVACQQAATMVAMKSATDNANDLVKEFKLAYNKARQAAITQELAEIVGGAAAV